MSWRGRRASVGRGIAMGGSFWSIPGALSTGAGRRPRRTPRRSALDQSFENDVVWDDQERQPQRLRSEFEWLSMSNPSL